MCLFIFLDCPAHSPFTLHNVLTNPSRAVLEAGLIRCLWYEALTGTSGTKQDPSAKRPAQTSEFQDENHACPYVVIKHDVEMFGGEAEAVQRINEAVLVGGIAHNERGCSDCWDVLYRKGWVGIMPNEAEKMKVLYTTDTGCSAREGSEKDTSRAAGRKRTRDDMEVSGDEGNAEAEAKADDDIAITEERVAKKSRNRGCQSLYMPSPTDSAAAACLVMPPAPWQVNKSKSEAYTIAPTGDGRNWNGGNDKFFQAIGLSKKEKRSSSERDGGESQHKGLGDPLHQSMEKMAEGMGFSSPSRSDEWEEDEADSEGSEDSEDENQVSEIEALPDGENPTPGQRVNCDNCEKRFFLLLENMPGPKGGFLCYRCSQSDCHSPTTKERYDTGELGRGQSAPVSNLLSPLLSSRPGLPAKAASVPCKLAGRESVDERMSRQGGKESVSASKTEATYVVIDLETDDDQTTNNDLDDVGGVTGSVSSAAISDIETAEPASDGGKNATLENEVARLSSENAGLRRELRDAKRQISRMNLGRL